jgi:hypothetical protein
MASASCQVDVREVDPNAGLLGTVRRSVMRAATGLLLIAIGVTMISRPCFAFTTETAAEAGLTTTSGSTSFTDPDEQIAPQSTQDPGSNDDDHQ